MVDKNTDSWIQWEQEDADGGEKVFAQLIETLPEYLEGATFILSNSANLSFYEDYRLFALTVLLNDTMEHVFALAGPGGVVWLNGESAPMHAVNDAESMQLSERDVTEYLKYFLYFLRSDGAAFVLIESPDEVTADSSDEQAQDADGSGSDEGGEDDEENLTLEAARNCARPLELEHGGDGPWRLNATVAFKGGLFLASFEVQANGEVEMVDDDPVGSLDGLLTPEVPALGLPVRPGAKSDGAGTSSLGRLAGGADDAPRDRVVTEAVVAVLLEAAIRDLTSTTKPESVILRPFNSQTQSGKPIQQLTKLVVDSQPIIMIESDIPFVEDFVVALVVDDEAPSQHAVRASASSGNDLMCELGISSYATQYLLSFQTYRSLFDAERVAHDLTLSDATVIIGCNRVADVPEPLRRVTDLTISFPRIDRRLFSLIFERVFGVKPDDRWDEPGVDWTQYLVPADFHAPRRLELGPDDALAMLRERVEVRLSQVTPDIGPRLEELHGMGEARQVAEDLIEDIRAAQVGEIPWSAVDKGMLLIGAPGTGKTTLARAIAKGCGVKFVVAKATEWQSAGALDAHLRAMRDDFSEARRYAPSILFIDEIDSIGSRETLAGPNAAYQTEVVNALLEEIQGIESVDGVIVIGATNYLDKVDPALRRAGRLDQVVEIPLPNIESLQKIYEYYLDEFRRTEGSLGTVDIRSLAELSFGLTGADVEFFIRGGARRARRLGRPLDQADLVAEITRRPRRADSAPRLDADEMHRVAVHEGGHTVARLISSTRGDDLAFATIVPRLDGSLGYVASLPANTRVMTRRMMLEYLQTVLAGRAAEEIVFGADEVGAGAGGSSDSSDLAVATRFAKLIVCQSGLGEDGSLLWTTTPTPAQEQQIEGLLRNGYRNILTRLRDNRELFDRVVAALVEKQELSGAELRSLAAPAAG
jgi:ATP-dependent Zn protease